MANLISSVGAMLLAAMAAFGAAPATQPAGQVSATPQEVAALIQQLGDDRFQVREAAQKRLIEIGSQEVVRQATAAKGSDSLEVRQRAGGILEAVAEKTRLQAARLIQKNVIWTYRLSGEPYWPVEASGEVLCLRDGGGVLRGLDAATGKQVWQVQGASFAVEGKRLFVLGRDGRLEVRDVATCKASKDLGGGDAAAQRILAVAEGTVYLAAGDQAAPGGRSKAPSRLLAIDAGSGAVKWAVDTSGPVLSAVVADGSVYAAGRTGRPGFVAAFDAATGKAKWTFDDPAAGYMAPRALTAAGGKVFFRLHWQVVALEAATGKKLWEHQAGGISIVTDSGREEDGPMALADGSPCVSWGTQITLLKPDDGSARWSYQPKLGEDGQDGRQVKDGKVQVAGNGRIIINGGALVVGGGAARVQIRAVAGGAGGGVVILNGQDLSASQLSRPAVADKAMYFTSSEGLHAVSTADRLELWRLPQKGLLPWRPVVAGGVVYFVGRGDNDQAGCTLYAMKLPEQPK